MSVHVYICRCGGAVYVYEMRGLKGERPGGCEDDYFGTLL